MSQDSRLFLMPYISYQLSHPPHHPIIHQHAPPYTLQTYPTTLPSTPSSSNTPHRHPTNTPYTSTPPPHHPQTRTTLHPINTPYNTPHHLIIHKHAPPTPNKHTFHIHPTTPSSTNTHHSTPYKTHPTTHPTTYIIPKHPPSPHIYVTKKSARKTSRHTRHPSCAIIIANKEKITFSQSILPTPAAPSPQPK